MINVANFYKISHEDENEDVKPDEEENKSEENDNDDEDTNVDNMDDDIDVDFNTNDNKEGDQDNNEGEGDNEGSDGGEANTDDNMGNSNGDTNTSDNGDGSDGTGDGGDVPNDDNGGDTIMDNAEGNEDGNTEGEETGQEDDANEDGSDLDSDPTNIDFNTTNGPDESKESVTDVVVDLTKAGDTETTEEEPSIEQESYNRLKLATEEAHEHLKLVEDLLANKERITKTSAVLSVETFKHIALKAGYRPDEMLSLSVISRESLNDNPEGVLLVIKEDLKEMIRCGLPL